MSEATAQENQEEEEDKKQDEEEGEGEEEATKNGHLLELFVQMRLINI